MMQAELSCLQIDSRGDLVGDRAEYAAFVRRVGFHAGWLGAMHKTLPPPHPTPTTHSLTR